MKTNFVKRRLFEGKPALGLVLGMGSPVEAEMLTHAGFDFLVVDNQYGAWNDESSMHAFWSMSLGPALPMTRVHQNDFYAIGRLPANLTQAQRDYFGAHTYERVDRPRGQFFHTDWTGQGGDVTAGTYLA
jgi:6-phosphogluconate dehydrogenase